MIPIRATSPPPLGVTLRAEGASDSSPRLECTAPRSRDIPFQDSVVGFAQR